MAETYRGFVLADALRDKIALYLRGSFMGHFDGVREARAAADDELRDCAVGVDRQLISVGEG